MNTISDTTTAATHDTLAMLEGDLRAGLKNYWQRAGTMLQGSPVHLFEPGEATFSLQRNFFSALFIYSYYRAGIPKTRRILYAAVNQCLRGMVTGCDNILDDEYKETLATGLPHHAQRFRSVLDIMVSDRILTEILFDYCRSHDLPLDKIIQAGKASLHSLLHSGAQEAAEEGGVTQRLRPEEILADVHHYKTGVLFKCPWAIPQILEDTTGSTALTVQEALYRIGMGCQLLDDMVDLNTDLQGSHHNYVLSAIFHEESPHVWQQLEAMDPSRPVADFYRKFPELHDKIKARALLSLECGLQQLFFDHHDFLVQPAVTFIAGRIGVQIAKN